MITVLIEMLDRQKFALVEVEDDHLDRAVEQAVKEIREGQPLVVKRTSTSAIVGSPTSTYGPEHVRWFNLSAVASVYVGTVD